MKEISYFKDSGNPTITVALAGISKLDWVYAKHRDSPDAASVIMKESKFDVLPVQNEDGGYTHCYQTKSWGNYEPDNIAYNAIGLADRLYYLTNINDAIKKFSLTNRKFFFLDNQVDIIGLITVGNLNCKHVYLYLYNLVAQVEQALGRIILATGVSNDELLAMFKCRKESKNARDAVSRYEADKKPGFAPNFIEYIYLTDLGYACKKIDLIKKLGISNTRFEDIIGHLNDVRTVVAHPNKTLIKNEQEVHGLYNLLVDIDFLLNSLDPDRESRIR